MTTNIEQKFFECFDIKPECDLPCQKRGVECINNTYCGNKYPDITAGKLLEMICLINKNTKNYNKSTYFKQDYKNLKDEILEETLFCYKTNCLFNKEKEQFKHQIQQLFKD